jgi:D-alanine-D-alanine ligase
MAAVATVATLNGIRRAVIAHNPVGEGADPATSDVLAQVELVESGLAALGIPAARVAAVGREQVERLRGEADDGLVVLNLVEAPPGAPEVHSLAAAALELLGLPYTGSSAAALFLTTDKLATRALLAAEGVPVAPGGRLDLEAPRILDEVPPPWILKPAREDASIGLEGNPLADTRKAALARGRELARRFPEQPVLVETFLPGREFNVSMLAKDTGVEVLPIAEMTYVDFPEGVPEVLGYEAKWDEGSFACEHTVRYFPADPADEPLLTRIRALALESWRICGLSGYARIDLRLDERGEPHVLEVNGNPCLAGDAGFMAAAREAGLEAGEVVRRIVEAALRPATKDLKDTKDPKDLESQGSLPSLKSLQSLRSFGGAIRPHLTPADRAPLAELIRATGFFNPEEEAVALELVDDRLTQGQASHYRFLIAEREGQVAGYACWGLIPGTASSVDLYWIAVHPGQQGKGTGRALLEAAERQIAEAGRTRVYIETSTRAQYTSTRGFYLACGYDLAAELPDYYAPGDGKAVFVKDLAANPR